MACFESVSPRADPQDKKGNSMRVRIGLLLGLGLLCSLSRAAEIIAPERHFGFRPGDDYRLVSWESLRTYFHAVERNLAASRCSRPAAPRRAARIWWR